VHVVSVIVVAVLLKESLTLLFWHFNICCVWP